MKIIRFIKGRQRAWRQRRAERGLAREFSRAAADEITRAEWAESLRAPTEFYLRCVHYFYARLPGELRAHRAYFETGGRGFGEKAFHVLWFLLFREFQPKSFLEIGVFRGQSLSLAAMLAREFKADCFIAGISPFTAAGDAVSKYRPDVDYESDTRKNFARFNLRTPELLRAFSTDAIASKLIASRKWDMIYIDGNHDYEVALQDWKSCAANVSPGGIIVLDDSGLTTIYRPPIFATGGHAGPSRLAQEIDRTRFREILQVGHNRVFEKIAA